MKKKSLFILLIPSLLLCACNSSSEAKGDSLKVSYKSTYFKNEDGSPINIETTISLKDIDFTKSNKEYDKNLALLSYGSAMNVSSKKDARKFFSSIGFKNIYYSPDYDVEETKDSINYIFARGKINDTTVVAVSLNGQNYRKPWENNFILGESGNAQGFETAANKVLSSLNTYLNGLSDYKLWMTGYSRSAGIANLVSLSLLDNNIVNEDDLFTYTFECPKAVDSSYSKEYQCIHNIVNSADIVTGAAPNQYGFKRVGVDKEMYTQNIDSVLASINPNLILNAFSSTYYYSTELDLVNYAYEALTTVIDPEYNVPDASTRANYVNNYQPTISYLFSLFMSFKESTMTDISTEFGKLDDLQKATLLADDKLYEFLYPIIDRNEEVYNKEEFHTAINKMVTFVTHLSKILILLLDTTSVIRTVQFHYPEIVLALLITSE